jgi:hypothetical protein
VNPPTHPRQNVREGVLSGRAGDTLGTLVVLQINDRIRRRRAARPSTVGVPRTAAVPDG